MGQTIAAIATPPGRGGVGIIKISGPQAKSIAQLIFSFAKKPLSGPRRLSPGRIHYGHIVDPETGRMIDEVLLFWMKAPYSYTGDDVVEIQAHANSLLLHQILSLVFARGARLARPGEFTLRAFLNGRIDLTQAESVIDLINAESKQAADIALGKVEGRFKNQILELVDLMENALSFLEADLDFSDEITDGTDLSMPFQSLQEKIIPGLSALIKNFKLYSPFTEGLRIGIAGAPNVGKSTLMNRLLGKDRVLVTSHPGTTRDIIEDKLFIGDSPVIILDTAGIRTTSDPVEQLGVNKALDELDKVHLLLYVVDASQSQNKSRIDPDILDRWSQKPLIVVFNKLDMVPSFSPESFSFVPPGSPTVCISAKSGLNISTLTDTINTILTPQLYNTDTVHIVPNLRQANLLEEALQFSHNALSQLRSSQEIHLASLDLTSALDCLFDIIGRKYSKNILDRIFQQFCIGK